MMMGLVPQNPARMPDSWTYSLGGLRGLDALFGLSDGIPPVSICKDANDNVIDCGTGQPVGGGGVQITPGSGGTVQGSCDPVMVTGGYVCKDNGDGTVTYTYVGAPGVSATVTVPAAGATPAPGGTGSAGAATVQGSGVSPKPGGAPPTPPVPAWVIWALVGAVVVFGSKAVS